jgi:hypothetical protein
VDLIWSKKYERIRVLFAAPVLLVALVFFSYHDAPKNGFHLDDRSNIYRYAPVMMTSLSIENILDAGRNAFLPRRPLPSMTFAVDWWRGSGDARPFQWTNIVIHSIAALSVFALIFLVLRSLQFRPRDTLVGSLVGAAIWACHPIQVQGVTYIVQRMTSMAALFTVLSVVLYILGRRSVSMKPRILFFLAAVVSWVLGLASKETALIAPFLVLLAEYGVVRHDQKIVRNRLDISILSIPALIAVLVVLDLISGVGPISTSILPGYETRDFTLAQRLLTQPRVIGFHLLQVFWPVPGRFSIEHDFVLSNGLLTPGSTLVALIGVVSWCVIGVRALLWRDRRVLGFFLLWVPATLAIESTIIPLEIIFEHRLYLPSAGLAGLAAVGVASMLRRYPGVFPLVAIVSVLAIGLLGYSTNQQVSVWQNRVTLAQNSVTKAPNSARAWGTLANALKEDGRGWDEILPPMYKALAIDPTDKLGLHLRTIHLIETGKLEEAAAIAAILAPIGDDDHSIVNTIGLLHFERKDYAGAVEQFSRAVELNPFVPEFRYNLALSYEYSRRCLEAKKAWIEFLRYTTDVRHQASVKERLIRNFELEGGRCYAVE